jgi:hypothetical protein
MSTGDGTGTELEETTFKLVLNQTDTMMRRIPSSDTELDPSEEREDAVSRSNRPYLDIPISHYCVHITMPASLDCTVGRAQS